MTADLTLAFTLAFFALGTIVGSFLSMLTYRLKHKIGGKVVGRSFCPHCKVEIRSYDLIPLLSYLFLKGKCRSCNKKVSWNYFLSELLTGLVFAIVFTNFNFLTGVDPIITVYWLTIFSLSLGIFFYDLAYTEIPLSLSVPMMVIGATGSYWLFGMSVTNIIIGGLIGKLFFYCQYKLSKGKWVGLGDSDLGTAMGLILGPIMLFVALMVSYILGSIVAIGLLAQGKAKMKTQLAFGPFLIVGLFITVFYGQELLDWYINLTLA